MYPQEVVNISWNDYGQLCGKLDKEIGNGLKYDSILAIARGGLPIGVYLSHSRGLPIFVISAQCYKDYQEGSMVTVCPHIAGVGKLGKNILLVDEINATGKTILAVKEHLRKHYEPNFVKTAVLITKPSSAVTPDYHVCGTIKEDQWFRFPYEREVVPQTIHHYAFSKQFKL